MNFEKMLQQIVVYALILVFGCSVGFSQPPAPPENVSAFDTPNDAGASITITWDTSPDDGAGAEAVTGYHVLRKSGESEFEVITKSPLKAGETRYVDKSAKDGPTYTYSVQAITASESAVISIETAPVKAVGNWFHFGKKWIFLALICFRLLWSTLSIMHGAGKKYSSAASLGLRQWMRQSADRLRWDAQSCISWVWGA